MAQSSSSDSSPIENKALSVDGIADLLAEDEVQPLSGKDDKSDKKTAEEIELKDDESEVEVSEDDEEKIELSEDEEETPEETEFTPHVGAKQILKKYPELFKEFPSLKAAYYKEQQFTELVGSLDDAKEIVEDSKQFKAFQSNLLDGNVDGVLKAVKNSDEQAFNKIVDNYLPTLQKVDRDAYFHVVSGVIKTAIIGMIEEAKSTDNEQLQQAAALLNQFAFGTSKFVPHQRLSSDTSKNSDVDKLNTEREQFMRERLDTAVNDLESKTDNVLKSTISNHIDPKGSMTDYVKRTASKEALEELKNAIGSDKRFRSDLDNLWKEAAKNNYDTNSVNKIRSAVLSKAKTLLPQVILKIRNEAIKGLAKRNGNDDEVKRDRRGPLPVGGGGKSTSSSKLSGNKSDGRGMSTFDFLNSD